MSISVCNEDILLPSIDVVLKWMGLPSLATIYTNHYGKPDFVSHVTLNKIAVKPGKLRIDVRNKIADHVELHYPGILQDTQAFLQDRTGTIGLGALKWLGLVNGLPAEFKAEYPYTLSVIEPIIDLEIHLVGKTNPTSHLASMLTAAAVSHPALLLLELNSPNAQINSLLLILAAFDAEYSAGNWVTDAKTGALNGLIHFKRKRSDQDYNRALWEWLLKLIEAQKPSVNSWNKLDLLMQESHPGEQDLESMERILRRYRTGKNRSGLDALVGKICHACWDNSDDASDITAAFSILHRGTTLLDHLVSEGIDMVSVENSYIEYYAYHAEILTGA